MFEGLIRRDAVSDINLRPDEKILHVTHLHPIVLLLRLVIPFSIMLLSIALAYYRSIGGQFMVMDVAYGYDFTLIDQILAVLLAATTIIWLWGRNRFIEGIRANLGMFAVWASMAFVLVVHFTGGRIFYVDPFAARSFDALGIVLITIAIIGMLVCAFLFYDWITDQLVLTNHRVVYDDEIPFIRQFQEQLAIADIQSVQASTKTYLEHWFNFGSIKIQSASFNRPLTFAAVQNPQEMQAKIMDEVNRKKMEENETDFRELIESKIYQTRPEEKKRDPGMRRSHTPRILGWLSDENPIYDRDTETYTWHPHWIFLVKALTLPCIALLIASAVLFGIASAELVSGGVFVFLVVAVIIGFLGWAAWEIEDHRNDRYILSPAQVIDIEKKPIGPESQRSAGLDALQNVSFKNTLIGRLLGYGNVLLETAGSGDGLTFYDIPSPQEVVTLINNYQEAFNKNQKERNMEDTLDLLRQYHETFQQEARRERQQQATSNSSSPAAPPAASNAQSAQPTPAAPPAASNSPTPAAPPAASNSPTPAAPPAASNAQPTPAVPPAASNAQSAQPTPATPPAADEASANKQQNDEPGVRPGVAQ